MNVLNRIFEVGNQINEQKSYYERLSSIFQNPDPSSKIPYIVAIKRAFIVAATWYILPAIFFVYIVSTRMDDDWFAYLFTFLLYFIVPLPYTLFWYLFLAYCRNRRLSSAKQGSQDG